MLQPVVLCFVGILGSSAVAAAAAAAGGVHLSPVRIWNESHYEFNEYESFIHHELLLGTNK